MIAVSLEMSDEPILDRKQECFYCNASVTFDKLGNICYSIEYNMDETEKTAVL